MSACEKCWGDAYLMSIGSRKSQGDCYSELVKERNSDPCSPKEQAGQFWNEEKQIDRRKL